MVSPPLPKLTVILVHNGGVLTHHPQDLRQNIYTTQYWGMNPEPKIQMVNLLCGALTLHTYVSMVKHTHTLQW